MVLRPWKKISEKVVAKNPWWEYRLADFVIPNGKQVEYHYMHGCHAVAIIGIDESGNIPLVRQYRPLYNRISLELPMGGLEDNQTHEQAAIEEFAQEAGLKAKQLEYIGKFEPSNARLDDWCYVYVGFNLVEINAESDETEEFEQVRLTFDEVEEKMVNGEIEDGMCMGCMAFSEKESVGNN